MNRTLHVLLLNVCVLIVVPRQANRRRRRERQKSFIEEQEKVTKDIQSTPPTTESPANLPPISKLTVYSTLFKPKINAMESDKHSEVNSDNNLYIRRDTNGNNSSSKEAVIKSIPFIKEKFKDPMEKGEFTKTTIVENNNELNTEDKDQVFVENSNSSPRTLLQNDNGSVTLENRNNDRLKDTGDKSDVFTNNQKLLTPTLEGDDISIASTGSTVSVASAATTDSGCNTDKSKRQSVSSLSDLEHLGKTVNVEGILNIALLIFNHNFY